MEFVSKAWDVCFARRVHMHGEELVSSNHRKFVGLVLQLLPALLLQLIPPASAITVHTL